MLEEIIQNRYAVTAVILFGIGFTNLMLQQNLLRKVIGFNIMDSAVFLLLASLGSSAFIGLRAGALASTISHDSHNFTVSYHDPKDAFRAAEILRACGGGICVIDGEQETHIALPAAGLMSQKPCAEVAGEIAAVQSALDVISDGQLTLLATAIMALPVLPSVVITDMGLVNGANQTFVPVFADAEA